MQIKLYLLKALMWLHVAIVVGIMCDLNHIDDMQFHLVRQCQRSRANILLWENTRTLEECIALSKGVRALAFNYAPHARRYNRLESNVTLANKGSKNLKNILDKPENKYNCMALECPENSTFRSMINDSRFDYFSLYGQPPEVRNYSCVPQVGLFQLIIDAENYTNAQNICSHSYAGTLAHIVSEDRTLGLSKTLRTFNEAQLLKPLPRASSIGLAYVGLHMNHTQQKSYSYHTSYNENLNCFFYRAWAPGYPKTGKLFENASCVALTTYNTWKNVECGRELAFLCEIPTSTTISDDNFDMGTTLADQCKEYF